ncbi:hypothetical protein DAETH_27610 [Deinococcus aetherius]|uniref:Uncharacterized protein n=1 Tax=Deinococcus aetherius TaxID=200252 RepID=A0ABM8AG79_9DEIO|nr:hypothetical protein DAETH_27610 [Deinococcus aetherius]
MDRQRWGSPYAPFFYQGVQYTLAHLNTLEYIYVQPASESKPERQFVVIIDFSDHCFTHAWKEGDDTALHYGPRKSRPQNERTFDTQRWQLSHNLPNIVRNLMGAKLYHNPTRDYTKIHITSLTQDGIEVEYEIYINVRFDK